MIYQTGDYLVHDGSGVCQIIDIDDMELMGKGSKKTYYIMTPVFKAGARVFTPIDQETVKLRSVTTPEEFKAIIDNIEDIKVIEEANDRVRAEKFKEVIGEFSPSSLASVVKTVLLREWAREAAGKKVMAQDERTLSIAGKKLYEEMAFSMNLDIKDVQNMFEDAVRSHSAACMA